MLFENALAACNLVAILRGIRPEEAIPIADVLLDAGFRLIEIPLNSPQPLLSIERLTDHAGDRAVIGAGTVLSTMDVANAAAAGARLAVSPNVDAEVIAATRRAGMVSLPGAATPSEAFTAVNSGAHAVKVFPAEMIPPAAIKAWRAVVPRHLPLLPVGGITPNRLMEYIGAGASGFGLGTALYRPGDDPAAVAANAARFLQALQREEAS